MSQPRKIFPLRLPQNYHGPVKTNPSLLLENRMKLSKREFSNPEELSPSKKVTTWQRKIKDREIINERRQFLVHPAKLSSDVPDWCKTTTNYFHRNEYQPRHRQSRAQWERFDVFNRERKLTYTNEPQNSLMTRTRFSQPVEVTSKVGWEDRARSTTFKEVTPKVGSVQFRDLSIKKPQLKVGKTQFVNTYSCF